MSLPKTSFINAVKELAEEYLEIENDLENMIIVWGSDDEIGRVTCDPSLQYEKELQMESIYNSIIELVKDQEK